jgi:tyrosinase
MFWLHHAMVDRTWWIWQNQKPIERAFLVNGTRTMFNDPPSGQSTMEDIINMAYVTPVDSPTYAMKHHVSSLGGPYCYIYG